MRSSEEEARSSRKRHNEYGTRHLLNNTALRYRATGNYTAIKVSNTGVADINVVVWSLVIPVCPSCVIVSRRPRRECCAG